MSLNLDSQHAERIALLPCWHGDVSIEALSGGITNRNYVVHDRERRFVARLSEDLRHLGIDRRNEEACQRAAFELGIAPAVEYVEPGVLVSAFVDGATCDAALVREPQTLQRLARTLRALHDGTDSISGDLFHFCPFRTVRTYGATIRELGGPRPEGIDDAIIDASRLGATLRPYTPTLCHNDLLPANILIDGESVWIVDWEYGGIGRPLFDVAGLSANSELSLDEEQALLETYAPQASGEDVREIQILKTVSLLREALWALIQVVRSNIDFDYEKYAQDNLSAYREARAQI